MGHVISACTLRGSEVGVDLWGIDVIHAIGSQIHMRCISNSSQSQLHSFNLLHFLFSMYELRTTMLIKWSNNFLYDFIDLSV